MLQNKQRLCMTLFFFFMPHTIRIFFYAPTVTWGMILCFNNILKKIEFLFIFLFKINFFDIFKLF
jgi:hypothetical protein